MMLLLFIAGLCFAVGLLVGLVLGCLGTQWALQTTRCPRCDELAALLDIRYACACGELVEREEI